jgi:hypothetical protein
VQHRTVDDYTDDYIGPVRTRTPALTIAAAFAFLAGNVVNSEQAFANLSHVEQRVVCEHTEGSTEANWVGRLSAGVEINWVVQVSCSKALTIVERNRPTASNASMSRFRLGRWVCHLTGTGNESNTDVCAWAAQRFSMTWSAG